MGFDEAKLYPSVYEDDPEAVALWRKVTGLPDDRIVRLGKRRTTGPWACPAPAVRARRSSSTEGRRTAPTGTVDPAEDRYLEFWNLVFMQEELSAVRSKEDFDIAGSLPKKNIDTGMGLERVAFLTQGMENMYEIDVMFPVIEMAERAHRPTLRRQTDEDDVRFRVIADHVRSSMMLISDGVTPGNEARGYVLRRLLRRAVRSMRLLGYEDPALPELFPVSRDKMGETYADLLTDWERISRVAYAEEEAFRKTLQAGTRSSTSRRCDVKKSGSTSSRATRRSHCTTPTASRST